MQLDQAKCYEDFKRVAHRMEALEETAKAAAVAPLKTVKP